MSLQICQLHSQLKDYICARNEDNQLMCRECFLQHSQLSGHSQAVRLSLDSKEFFLQWTEYVLKKMVQFKQIVSQMGYSKVFQMRLESNHPKGSVHELNFQDIEKVAMQALEQHRAITQGNLTFIKGTTTILQMMVPQFLKDLYNIICEDTKFNLSNMLIEFSKKLINSYPQKDIYKFATFTIVERELLTMEERRRALLAQYEGRIVLLGKGGQVLRKVTDKEVERDYITPSLHSSIPLNDSIEQISNRPSSYQYPQTLSPTNISTISNPSMTQNEPKQMQYTQRDINDTVSQTNKQQQFKFSREQMQTTVAFLRQNEVMHREKIVRLQQENSVLKSQIERLNGLENKVKELQKKLVQAKTFIPTTSQKISQQLSSQLQSSLKQQIHDLTITQASLIEQNSKINHTLKDLSDIAQGRSRTITDLQQQIKTLTQNLQLKQRSIQQLNMLISNQQQQIAYRQNEVEILGEQIKKKLQRIQFLQKSIQEHTKIVNNEQLQLSYRQNQVKTLNDEIQKLKARNEQLQKSIKSLNSLITNEEEQLAYRENEVQILQQKINKLLNKINQLQKSIHELNNLIGNEEEEIKYRENEVGTLNEEVRRLLSSNKILIEENKMLKQRVVQLNIGSSQVSSDNEEKAKLLQTQLNLINEQNIQLTDQVKILKQKHALVEGQLRTQAEKSARLEVQLKAIQSNYTMLETEVTLLKSELLNVRAQLTLSQEQVNSIKVRSERQDFNTQLAAQVIELESQLLTKINDVEILSQVIEKDLAKYLSKSQFDKINQKLSISLIPQLRLE